MSGIPIGQPPISQPPITVSVDAVSKWFGNVVAVSEVSFTLGPGVTAILGPNGAGKSTLMRVLCGLTPPSRGQVKVLGGDPRTDPAVRSSIGLVPQQEQLFEFQRAIEFVELAGRLMGTPNPGQAARDAMDRVEMDPNDARPIATYSKGMRQRVKLAQALVSDPAVIVADEPLNGLDPRQRRSMTALFQSLGEEGRTVVISSHVLDEVERFGSQVVVLAQGRLAATGDFHAIRRLMDDRPHRFRLRTDNPRAVASALMAWEPVVGLSLTDEALLLDVVDVASFRRGVIGRVRSTGARLTDLVPLDDDLESVFRYLVGS